MRISDWSSDVCSSDLLDRLLPEIVIDPEDLGFVQDREDRPVQGPCRSEIRTERLLHDHPAPSVGVVAHTTCGPEPPRSEERRVGKACVRPCISRWTPDIALTKYHIYINQYHLT